jgi:hypothetical protein
MSPRSIQEDYDEDFQLVDSGDWHVGKLMLSGGGHLRTEGSGRQRNCYDDGGDLRVLFTHVIAFRCGYAA